MSRLIDRVMPAWDFHEQHHRRIPAAPDTVYRALPRVDLAQSPWIGLLFALRSLPARLRPGEARLHTGEARLRTGTLGDFFASGFVPLIEERPHGLVLGSIGEFWRAAGAVRRFDPGTFAANRDPGCARLAWCFEFAPADGGCCVTTETRIACNDRAAYRRMLAYWIAIRPASGFIRREILRLLARGCREA